jgi:hypothetical protein
MTVLSLLWLGLASAVAKPVEPLVWQVGFS